MNLQITEWGTRWNSSSTQSFMHQPPSPYTEGEIRPSTKRAHNCHCETASWFSSSPICTPSPIVNSIRSSDPVVWLTLLRKVVNDKLFNGIDKRTIIMLRSYSPVTFDCRKADIGFLKDILWMSGCAIVLRNVIFFGRTPHGTECWFTTILQLTWLQFRQQSGCDRPFFGKSREKPYVLFEQSFNDSKLFTNSNYGDVPVIIGLHVF